MSTLKCQFDLQMTETLKQVQGDVLIEDCR